jgi:hypothetical protein
VFVHLKGQKVPDEQKYPDQGSVRKKAIELLNKDCINGATGLINAVGLFNQGKKNEEINICIGNVQSGNGEPYKILPETNPTDTTQTVSTIKAMPPNSRQIGMNRRCDSIKSVAGVRSEK